jgi:6-phosphofructo-2-kinase
MTQAIQTSKTCNEEEYEVRLLKELDDLNAGKIEGLTFKQVEKTYPKGDEATKGRFAAISMAWPRR